MKPLIVADEIKSVQVVRDAAADRIRIQVLHNAEFMYYTIPDAYQKAAKDSIRKYVKTVFSNAKITWYI